MQMVSSSGGGGGSNYDEPLKFLLVKVEIGKGFPVEKAKVGVKLVVDGPGKVEAKEGELDKKKPDIPVRVYYSENDVDHVAGGGVVTGVEISLTDKADNKTSLGKKTLHVPADRTTTHSPALYRCSLSNGKNEEIHAVVWWAVKENPDFLKAVEAGPRIFSVPNLVYYNLQIVYLKNLAAALIPPNTVFRVNATIGAHSSATEGIFNPFLSPVTANMNRLVWFVKVFREHPPAGELKVELQVAPADSHRRPCGQYKVVASGVQKLEEVYDVKKNKEGVDIGLKKPKSGGGGGGEDDEGKKESVAGLVRVAMGQEAPHCHVFEEEPDKCSDLRTPTQIREELWNGPPAIGYLQFRVHKATRVRPMKVRGGKPTADTYCLARYGRKWHQTRTVLGSLEPVFEEQCNWHVFDTHTVFSIALFDNRRIPEAVGGQKGKEVADKYMGKVVIRISTLFPSRQGRSNNRTFSSSTFPLYLIQPNPPDGFHVKLMAKVHLSYRFTLYPWSFKHFLPTLFRSPLPAPNPRLVPPEAEILRLRHTVVAFVAEALSRQDPPVAKAVVEDMYGDHEPCFSHRRYRTHGERLHKACSPFFLLINSVMKAFAKVDWLRRTLFLSLFAALIFCSDHIPHVLLIYFFLIGLYNFGFRRPNCPPQINPTLLHIAKETPPSIIDEEADTTPSSRPPEVIKFRHDELSKVVGGIERSIGRVATNAVKLGVLLRWRDPRATGILVALCVAAAVGSYFAGPSVCCVLAGLAFFGLHSPLSCFMAHLHPL